MAGAGLWRSSVLANSIAVVAPAIGGYQIPSKLEVNDRQDAVE